MVYSIEESLVVNHLTMWADEKRRIEEKRRERIEENRTERVRGKKMQVRKKVGKPQNTSFFHWFVTLEGGKVGSLKRRPRSCGQRRDEKKKHTAAGRSTCPSQNVQSTPCWDHLWTLRCRKGHAVVARGTCPSQNVQTHHVQTFGS